MSAAELSEEIERLLEQISPASGYATNIQGVYGFGKTKPDDAPRPCLLVRVSEDTGGRRVGNKVERLAVYEVAGVFSRAAPLQDLQRCHHDVLRSLGYGNDPPNRALAGAEIIEESAEFDPDTGGSLMRTFVARITLRYVEQY